LAKIKPEYSTTKGTSSRSLKGIFYWPLFWKQVCAVVLV